MTKNSEYISKKYAFVFLYLSSIITGHASELSPESMYFRCYAHMTRSRPLENDTRLAKVKSGQLTYVDACMQVFDLAQLDKNTGRLKTVDSESIRVLENFNRFHVSWFDDVDLFNAIYPGRENINFFLHDGSEAALHFTRAVFHPDGRFADAITSNDTWQAIRSEGYNTLAIYPLIAKTDDGFATKNTMIRVGVKTNDIPLASVLDPNNLHNGLHIQMGKLVGIMPMEHLEVAGASEADWTTIPYSGSNKVSITKSFGGGLIGTQSYLLLNKTHYNMKEDGALRSSRIYGKQVFKEVLCRDLPVVQQKDAITLVDPSGTNPQPYRNNSSCMQCHSSIDPLGWTTRNLRMIRTGDGTNNHYQEVLNFYESYKGNKLNKEDGPVFGLGAKTTADNNFHKRPSNGHFYFRTFDGKLISKPVQNLSDVGLAISELDDYYTCASKRYFEFFTGHKIHLNDFTSSNTAKPNEKELKIRNYVIDLGKKLHTHQSMRNVVKDILSSDFYRSSDYEIKFK